MTWLFYIKREHSPPAAQHCRSNIKVSFIYKSCRVKLLLLAIKLFLVLMLISCFSNCRKSNVPSVNIVLYNKPLSEIRENIQGKWKLQYGKGGICSTCKSDFSNQRYLWEFSMNDKINRTYNDSVYTDAPIQWTKDLVYYTNGDSTYVMNFYDNRRYPYNYVVDRIYNDTLILFDAYSIDAVYYYFVKSN